MLTSTFGLVVGFLLLAVFFCLVVSPIVAWKRRAPDAAPRRHRRWAIGLVTVVVILLMPLWIGYFGPTALLYFTYWTPLRTEVAVNPYVDDGKQRAVVSYRDLLPDLYSDPGNQTEFIWLARSSKAVPWRIVESDCGP